MAVPRLDLRERLEQPAAFLSRTDLRELGLERRAVDQGQKPADQAGGRPRERLDR